MRSPKSKQSRRAQILIGINLNYINPWQTKAMSSKKPFKHLGEKLQSDQLDSEIEPFIALNHQVFWELLTFIDFAEGLTLGFVEINFSKDVDTLIQALKNNPHCEEVQFCCFDFAGINVKFLRDAIIERLTDIAQLQDKKLVLIIQGLEKSIGMFGDYPPVLQDLNFVRDAFTNSVPYPIVFFLPDYAIARVVKFAPDFWAWKSVFFRSVGC